MDVNTVWIVGTDGSTEVTLEKDNGPLVTLDTPGASAVIDSTAVFGADNTGAAYFAAYEPPTGEHRRISVDANGRPALIPTTVPTT